MGKFRGFSEKTLLYADNYHIIKALRDSFAKDREALFGDLQDAVSKCSWLDPKLCELRSGAAWLTISFRGGSGDTVPEIGCGLGTWDLSKSDEKQRHLRTDLYLHESLKPFKQAKEWLHKELHEELLESQYSSEEYSELRYSNPYILRCQLPLQTDDVIQSVTNLLEPMAEMARRVVKIIEQHQK